MRTLWLMHRIFVFSMTVAVQAGLYWTINSATNKRPSLVLWAPRWAMTGYIQIQTGPSPNDVLPWAADISLVRELGGVNAKPISYLDQ